MLFFLCLPRQQMFYTKLNIPHLQTRAIWSHANRTGKMALVCKWAKPFCLKEDEIKRWQQQQKKHLNKETKYKPLPLSVFGCQVKQIQSAQFLWSLSQSSWQESLSWRSTVVCCSLWSVAIVARWQTDFTSPEETCKWTPSWTWGPIVAHVGVICNSFTAGTVWWW